MWQGISIEGLNKVGTICVARMDRPVETLRARFLATFAGGLSYGEAACRHRGGGRPGPGNFSSRVEVFRHFRLSEQLPCLVIPDFAERVDRPMAEEPPGVAARRNRRRADRTLL